MKMARITEFGSETTKFYVLGGAFELTEVNIDDIENGYEKGFLNENREWITEDNVDNFDIIQAEKVSTELDYYSKGVDKVILSIKDEYTNEYEEVEVVSSRWENQCAYYFINEDFMREEE